MAHLQAFLLCSILSYHTAAVTVIPLTLNFPKPYKSADLPTTSDSDLLSKLLANTNLDNNAFYSSYMPTFSQTQPKGVYASQDSFFRGAIDASAKHQHLVIQPQDVWYTVLKQLSFYLRKHKDDKEVAEVWDNLDGKTTLPMYSMFMVAIENWTGTQFNLRSKADWLLDWVRPTFTTATNPNNTQLATPSDEMLANALMMAMSAPTTSEPFPAFPCKNGMPSVTLNGTQDDWKKLLTKVESLEKFGKEPKIYAIQLHLVLSRFIQTFDKPNDLAIRTFWSNMITAVPRQRSCDTTELVTGWINVFHMWNPAGNLAVTAPFTTPASDASPATSEASEAFELDGTTFLWRHIKDIPVAHSHIPMCVEGDTLRWSSYPILVGMLAKKVKQGKPAGYDAALKSAGFTLPSSVAESDHSTLQPLPMWIAHSDYSVNYSPFYTTPRTS
jgi:hypothetical protein